MSFNSTAIFQLKVVTPDGPQTVELTYPSDKQQADRLRKQRLITRSLGRGISETEIIPNHQADLELVNELKQDAQLVVDEYTATELLSRLLRAEAEPAERQGNQYVISIRTAGGMTKHTLKPPTPRDKIDYANSSAKVIDRRHGVSETRINLEPAGALYDKLVVSVDGVDGEVPLVVKSAAVTELLQTIRDEEAADEDDSYFRLD